MSKVAFNKTLNIPKDVASWEKQNQMEMLQEKLDIVTIPWHDYEKVAQMFDVVDVIFDLPGYIAGYGVSPDSRQGELEEGRNPFWHGIDPQTFNVCMEPIVKP